MGFPIRLACVAYNWPGMGQFWQNLIMHGGGLLGSDRFGWISMGHGLAYVFWGFLDLV